MQEIYSNSTIILIMIITALIGGLTNFFMLYDKKLTTNENWIKFFAAFLLSSCAVITVPLFLQILSNNILDTISFKNCLIFSGFCIVAAFFSKRFIEDVYSKLNKLKDEVNEVKKDTSNKIETVSEKTEKVIKKVEDLVEDSEELETDNEESETNSVSTEIKESLSTYKKSLLAEGEDIKIITALSSNKYSWRTVTGIAKETKIDVRRIQETLNHLHEHGFVEKRAPQKSAKVLWRILKYPIRIYSANYGLPGRFTDVTEKIKEMIANGIYEGTTSHLYFNISDPAPYVSKVLKIHCRVHGEEKELIFKEGDPFIIA